VGFGGNDCYRLLISQGHRRIQLHCAVRRQESGQQSSRCD
jgi:hypothetical protein